MKFEGRTATFLQKYEPQVYALLRIVAGFLFLWHGSQKLFGFPAVGVSIPLHIVVIAGTIEFFGGLLILLGFLTRWAAFIASGQMAYAYWSVHGLKAILPIENHGEMAMLYCFLFLYIATAGSGIWSLDTLLQRPRNRT